MLTSDEYEKANKKLMDEFKRYENQAEADKKGAEYHHKDYKAFKR